MKLKFWQSKSKSIKEEIPSQEDSGKWMSRINACDMLRNTWYLEAGKFWDLYNGLQSNFRISWGGDTLHDFKVRNNIFYSNINILNSALVQQLPRIYIIEDDKIGNTQNPLLANIEAEINLMFNDTSFGRCFREFKKDLLVSGQGVLWLDVLDDDGIVVNPCLVRYTDFYFTPVENWVEVWWIARRIYLSKLQVEQKFGKEIANNVKYTNLPNFYKRINVAESVTMELCEFFEVWDKRTRTRFYITSGISNKIDEREDFLGLNNFFPCVQPLTFMSNEILTPIPEGRMYISDIVSLNILESRIGNIIRNIRPVAYFDSTLGEIFSEAKFADDGSKVGIPIDKTILGGKGVESLFFYEPIDIFAETLTVLNQQKEQVIQNIREISGVSDIMALNTQPAETATATLQKGKFGTMRLMEKQQLVYNYLKSIYLLALEIKCSFVPDLAKKFQVLKIELETSFDISRSSEQNQQRGIALFDMIIKNAELISGIAKTNTKAASLMTKLLEYSVAPFLETYSQKMNIEQLFMAMSEEQTQEGQEQLPNPEMVAAQAEQMKGQAEMLKAQVQEKSLEIDRLKLQLEQMKVQQKDREIDAKIESETLKVSANAAAKVADTIENNNRS